MCTRFHAWEARSSARGRGFTLVELMIVVAIVAILVTTAGIYLSSPRDLRALRQATNQTTQLVQQLRNRAMSTGNAVILEISAHEPLPDMLDGGALVGEGTESSQIAVFDAVGANCTPRETAVLIPTEVLDPTRPTLPYRHTVITRIAPTVVGGVRSLCFTPTGRVVDPLTNRPFSAAGSSIFGGRFYIEFRPALCVQERCHLRPFRRTLVVGFNGLVEQMPDDFDMGDL